MCATCGEGPYTLRFSNSCHRHHSSNRHSQALSTTDSKINYKIYNYPPYTNKYYLKNETTTMRVELIFVGSNSHQVNSPYEFCVRKPSCGTLDGLTLHVGLTRGFTQLTRNKRQRNSHAGMIWRRSLGPRSLNGWH